MEAERLALLHRLRIMIDREKVGELPAQQFFRLALEIVGKLARYVGEGAERIGFPEPAAAAVFELVDEMLRFARVGLEPEPFSARLDEAARAGRTVSEQHRRQDRDTGSDQWRVGEYG